MVNISQVMRWGGIGTSGVRREVVGGGWGGQGFHQCHALSYGFTTVVYCTCLKGVG